MRIWTNSTSEAENRFKPFRIELFPRKDLNTWNDHSFSCAHKVLSTSRTRCRGTATAGQVFGIGEIFSEELNLKKLNGYEKNGYWPSSERGKYFSVEVEIIPRKKGNTDIPPEDFTRTLNLVSERGIKATYIMYTA